jgi:hypothetical protein
MPRAQFKNRYDFLPTLQLSLKIIALFEKIYSMMETSGRMYCMYNVHDRFFKKVCDVKSVTQSDTVPLLENNY